jgi:hypothetical protein
LEGLLRTVVHFTVNRDWRSYGSALLVLQSINPVLNHLCGTSRKAMGWRGLMEPKELPARRCCFNNKQNRKFGHKIFMKLLPSGGVFSALSFGRLVTPWLAPRIAYFC